MQVRKNRQVDYAIGVQITTAVFEPIRCRGRKRPEVDADYLDGVGAIEPLGNYIIAMV
jgi:hypothetical protein